jgi:hypothetical protein
MLPIPLFVKGSLWSFWVQLLLLLLPTQGYLHGRRTQMIQSRIVRSSSSCPKWCMFVPSTSISQRNDYSRTRVLGGAPEGEITDTRMHDRHHIIPRPIQCVQYAGKMTPASEKVGRIGWLRVSVLIKSPAECARRTAKDLPMPCSCSSAAMCQFTSISTTSSTTHACFGREHVLWQAPSRLLK